MWLDSVVRFARSNGGSRPIAVLHGPIRNDCNVQKAEVQCGGQKAAQQRLLSVVAAPRTHAVRGKAVGQAVRSR